MMFAMPTLIMIHMLDLQIGQRGATDECRTLDFGFSGSALSATTLSILIMQHTKSYQTEYILCRQFDAPALAVFYAMDLAFG